MKRLQLLCGLQGVLIPVSLIFWNKECSTSRAEEEKIGKIVFLGTGSSVGMPHPFHLMQPESCTNEEERNRYAVSWKGAQGDPAFNKNYRCNPSLLIQFQREGSERNVIIDCGKTFRESILRWFPRYKVRSVDAIVLTHGHADAIFGLDDVRSVQPRNIKAPMDVYLSPECLKVVSYTFPYLFPKAIEEQAVHRFVAAINWVPFTYYHEFSAAGMKIKPLPVMHGEDMFCTAFIFGEKDRICYISDISRMLPSTLDEIKREPKIHILILDALLMNNSHPTHQSMKEAITLAKEICPTRTLLVGMSSEFDHDKVS
jgi:phosphoribosyl 1,2-cyclic phosphodiesterase